jgi:aminomuconate-semialdehyde/2-hydroxymuconate-6-semialdehyde dehydrogenase
MPADLKDGCWIQPTIWTGLPETATVVTEEIFGPCCHIQPFDNEEEVLQMVNANRYGLATSIHTQDIGRAMRLASAIEVGLCWINSWFLRDLRTPLGPNHGQDQDSTLRRRALCGADRTQAGRPADRP